LLSQILLLLSMIKLSIAYLSCSSLNFTLFLLSPYCVIAVTQKYMIAKTIIIIKPNLFKEPSLSLNINPHLLLKITKDHMVGKYIMKDLNIQYLVKKDIPFPRQYFLRYLSYYPRFDNIALFLFSFVIVFLISLRGITITKGDLTSVFF